MDAKNIKVDNDRLIPKHIKHWEQGDGKRLENGDG